MNKVSILACAHNNSQFIRRFLSYVTSNWDKPTIHLAWSGEKNISKNDFSIYLDKCTLKIHNYSHLIEFHEKIYQTVKKISEKYFFLIGIDDYPIYSFSKLAFKALERTEKDICSGIRLLENNGKFKMHLSTIPTQKEPLNRAIQVFLYNTLNNKSLIGNWHIYSIYRTTSFLEVLLEIPKYQKYSAHLEQLIITILFTKSKSIYIDKVCSIHDGEHIGIQKTLKNGGFNNWGIEKNYFSAFKKILKHYLNAKELKLFQDFMSGEKYFELPKSFIFSNKLHRLIYTTPFEMKIKNRKKKTLQKLSIITIFLYYKIFIFRNLRIKDFSKISFFNQLIEFISCKDTIFLKEYYNNLLEKNPEYYPVIKLNSQK